MSKRKNKNRLALPFEYPRSRHARRQRPAPYANYKHFKPALRIEFRERCVYCCMPDGATTAYYHVDHYRPKNPPWAGADRYENLFYSCEPCNVFKGNYWPNAPQRRMGLFIPNPCSHLMREHLGFRQHEIVGRSKTGDFAIEYLDLNSAKIVAFRKYVANCIANAINARNEHVSRLGKLRRKLNAEADPTKRTKLESAQAMLRTRLRDIEDDLRRLRGNPR